VCAPADAAVKSPSAVWLCAGICVVSSVTVAAPPVASTAYVLPAPTTNRSRRFGVPLVPSHIAQFAGIDATDPDHKIIPPIGKAAEAAVDAA
jgi:hypothetical protein